MAELIFETIINAPLCDIWSFHDDPVKGLCALSPPAADVKIISADLPIREGSRITISACGPFGRRIHWIARIIEHLPPHSVVFGEEARFVDVQESGPFASWVHRHEFEAVGEKQTRVVDRVSYRLPFGPLGWIADYLGVRREIRKMFRYRHAATHRALEKR